MATVAIPRMTAEEFWEFVQRPENQERRFELERGKIVEMPVPGKYHGFVCATIATLLMICARTRRNCYACSNDSGVLVERGPDTVRGPDVCFYEDGQTPESRIVVFPGHYRD